MKTMLGIGVFTLLALAAPAHSSVSNHAQVWRYPIDTEDYGFSVWTEDGSDAVLQLHERMKFIPVDLALDSTTTSRGFDVSARMSWDASAPVEVPFNGNGVARGTQRIDRWLEPGERIRFRVDYDLSSSRLGENRFAFEVFTDATGLENRRIAKWIDSGTYGGPESDHDAGTWYSDWLTAPEDGVNVIAYSDLRALSGVMSDNGYEAGSSYALGRVEIRYEIAPVPEPETYALLLAGLGSVGWAARRRRAAGRA